MHCETFQGKVDPSVSHEPAMDLLFEWPWARSDGIEPLLGCVPRLHPQIYGRHKKVSATIDSLLPVLQFNLDLNIEHLVTMCRTLV